MATRRPIVRIDGRLKELPVGDTLPGGGGASPLHIGTSAPPDPDAKPFWWDETAGVFVVHIGGGVYIEPGANFVPPDGTAGQVLAKASANDHDLEWVDPPAGVSPILYWMI